jgi:hypothetical protein
VRDGVARGMHVSSQLPLRGPYAVVSQGLQLGWLRCQGQRLLRQPLHNRTGRVHRRTVVAACSRLSAVSSPQPTPTAPVAEGVLFAFTFAFAF